MMHSKKCILISPCSAIAVRAERRLCMRASCIDSDVQHTWSALNARPVFEAASLSASWCNKTQQVRYNEIFCRKNHDVDVDGWVTCAEPLACCSTLRSSTCTRCITFQYCWSRAGSSSMTYFVRRPATNRGNLRLLMKPAPKHHKL